MSLRAAFGLGAVTGMRSMMGLAVFSNHANQEKSSDNPVLKLLKRPEAAAVLKLMATGEVVMDKMPFTPDRVALQPLIGRMVLGGLVGAAAAKHDWIKGGAAGALGALSAAYASYYIRKALHDDRHIPNVVLGIVEDAVVVKLANTVVQNYEKG